jgi:hypothetical protein
MFRKQMLLFVVSAFGLVGCSKPVDSPTPAPLSPPKAMTNEESSEITAVRAKLSPEDKALVEAQEWCVISTEERLGSMGAPIKLDIKGQPVFVCCAGCQKKAKADPDATLAKVAELKAKAKQEKK